MTKMAILAKMAKMTPNAWFSIISDFWGDLSRSFFIRWAIRAHLGALQLGLLKHGRKWRLFDIVWLHVKKRPKMHFFSY